MFKSKSALVTMTALLAFSFGLGVNNFALSDVAQSNEAKIGVVNVPVVVSNSSKVLALKKQQEAKREELTKWLNTVKADIAKQTTKEGKQKLAKKYDAELAKKQQANKDEYAKKLAEIDREISNVIAQTAKVKGYNVVFSKSAVLYGGTDLTADIQKAVK